MMIAPWNCLCAGLHFQPFGAETPKKRLTLTHQLKAFKAQQPRYRSTLCRPMLVLVEEATRWQLSKEWLQRKTFWRCRWRTGTVSWSCTRIVGQESFLNIANVFLGRCFTAIRFEFHKMQMIFSHSTWRDAIPKEETALRGAPLRLLTATLLVSVYMLMSNG